MFWFIKCFFFAQLNQCKSFLHLIAHIAYAWKTWTLTAKSSNPFTLADHTLYSIFVRPLKMGMSFCLRFVLVSVLVHFIRLLFVFNQLLSSLFSSKCSENSVKSINWEQKKFHSMIYINKFWLFFAAYWKKKILNSQHKFETREDIQKNTFWKHPVVWNTELAWKNRTMKKILIGFHRQSDHCYYSSNNHCPHQRSWGGGSPCWPKGNARRRNRIVCQNGQNLPKSA